MRKRYSKPKVLWRGELPDAGILFLDAGAVAWEIVTILRVTPGVEQGEPVQFIKKLHRVP